MNTFEAVYHSDGISGGWRTVCFLLWEESCWVLCADKRISYSENFYVPKNKFFLGIICFFLFSLVSDFKDDFLYPYGLAHPPPSPPPPPPPQHAGNYWSCKRDKTYVLICYIRGFFEIRYYINTMLDVEWVCLACDGKVWKAVLSMLMFL
jgi:hypothetical protein